MAALPQMNKYQVRGNYQVLPGPFAVAGIPSTIALGFVSSGVMRGEMWA
jgi:hypothetical protein